ncbi:MAG TPA: hypothetical protein VNN17_01225 [Terriglobia bacterium]|nr:hypothetical protein [Terriglobia bacterium]
MRRAIRAMTEDHRSGSARLALRACQLLGRCPAGPASDPLAHGRPLAQAVAAAQPAMAAVGNACRRWLQRVERGMAPQQAAHRVAQELAQAQRAAAGHAARLIRSGQAVATWSASFTVETALLQAHRSGRRFRVLCAEGRPRYEGRALARRLAAGGLSVELFTDAALLAAIPDANLALVGCDALFPRYFVNKTGTHALCRLARAARIPVWVVADTFKFLPAAAGPAFRIREENPAEVWTKKPARLRVRNFYFERVPLEACSAIITEQGLSTPGQLRRRFRAAFGNPGAALARMDSCD